MVNGSSVILFILGLFLVAAVLFGTFYHEYDYSRRVFTQSFEAPPISLSDIENLKGNFVSLQYNSSGTPTWILSGKWRIDSSVVLNNASRITFSANITMVGTNGKDEHRHRLIDFRLLNLTFIDRIVIMKGTVSLVTSGKDPIGNTATIYDIPMNLRIENIRTISLDIDKKKVDYHFGAQPIFGTVAGTTTN